MNLESVLDEFVHQPVFRLYALTLMSRSEVDTTKHKDHLNLVEFSAFTADFLTSIDLFDRRLIQGLLDHNYIWLVLLKLASRNTTHGSRKVSELHLPTKLLSTLFHSQLKTNT